MSGPYETDKSMQPDLKQPLFGRTLQQAGSNLKSINPFPRSPATAN